MSFIGTGGRADVRSFYREGGVVVADVELAKLIDDMLNAPPQSLELVHRNISQLIAEDEDVEKHERIIWLLEQVAEKRGLVWRDEGMGMRLYRKD